MLCIHHGSRVFSPRKFNRVQNQNHPKPFGGLWASPVGVEYGWDVWCLDEDFHVELLALYFLFEINEDKLLVIDSVYDLELITWRETYPGRDLSFMSISPDYELMAKQYDAIHLTARGQWATRLTTPRNLYGWDCECVFVMNKDAIRVQRKNNGRRS
jgi:hypothetical protein